MIAATFEISGDLAHRCLLSIPIKVPQALSVIDEYRKYLEFQSTIEILKGEQMESTAEDSFTNIPDPPSDYMMPATDLMGGLDKIKESIRNGKYRSQYEADDALQRLILSANDGHLSLSPCTSSYFEFTHEDPLVSVSSDGLELPQVFTLSMFSP